MSKQLFHPRRVQLIFHYTNGRLEPLPTLQPSNPPAYQIACGFPDHILFFNTQIMTMLNGHTCK